MKVGLALTDLASDTHHRRRSAAQCWESLTKDTDLITDIKMSLHHNLLHMLWRVQQRACLEARFLSFSALTRTMSTMQGCLNLSSRCVTLMRRCLHLDPKKRVTAEELL
ncbi:hypothetical protein NEOLEDRAFT_468107 [Neolentinus lepideus HHB14362 ss-1]|uniref:Protein kinase domain-containing protein n=1 Tax=Neolentinus lepideus HHB14362 ss-1 TaxID=1314782 RepID=A0A165VID6_9AGAM|nr:hypothetical protein NEOLEDRAFT_468107 [Neolentinus lepideus HHB14362 ss-1]